MNIKSDTMKCDEGDWSDNTWICSECGGDVHDHFGDENRDCEYWTWAHCHKCGESFSRFELEDLERSESEGEE